MDLLQIMNVALGVALVALVLYLQISRGMYRSAKKIGSEESNIPDAGSKNPQTKAKQSPYHKLLATPAERLTETQKRDQLSGAIAWQN